MVEISQSTIDELARMEEADEARTNHFLQVDKFRALVEKMSPEDRKTVFMFLYRLGGLYLEGVSNMEMLKVLSEE